jgi:hypothetical protein
MDVAQSRMIESGLTGGLILLRVAIRSCDVLICGYKVSARSPQLIEFIRAQSRNELRSQLFYGPRLPQLQPAVDTL